MASAASGLYSPVWFVLADFIPNFVSLADYRCYFSGFYPSICLRFHLFSAGYGIKTSVVLACFTFRRSYPSSPSCLLLTASSYNNSKYVNRILLCICMPRRKVMRNTARCEGLGIGDNVSVSRLHLIVLCIELWFTFCGPVGHANLQKYDVKELE